MSNEQVTVSGEGLSIDEVVSVARNRARVAITDDEKVQERVRKSNEFILNAVENNQPIYGVTSGFGAMAYKAISKDQAIELQNNIPWFHKVGTGNLLPQEDVRAAILVRMNSHLQGASGIRMSMVERMGTFLNKGAIKKELAQLPDNCILVIDQSNCVYINHDVAEIISDFIHTASSRGITVEIIERKNKVQSQLSDMQAAA